MLELQKSTVLVSLVDPLQASLEPNKGTQVSVPTVVSVGVSMTHQPPASEGGVSQRRTPSVKALLPLEKPNSLKLFVSPRSRV